MNPKMKSAIEKITLNDATFSNEVIEIIMFSTCMAE